MLRARLEHVEECRDERIDPTTDVLQIEERDVERIHHRSLRPAYFAIQAEHRNTVARVVKVGGLNHVVLLVAAQSVLRAEGRAELHVPDRRERIERMREIGRHRCGVCNERNAFAREGSSQSGVTEEAVDAEEHGKAGGYRLGAGGSEHYRRCGRIGCQCHRTGYGLGGWGLEVQNSSRPHESDIKLHNCK